MATRTIAQVLSMHDEVVKAVKAQLEAAGKPKPVQRNFAVKQKEQRLKSMQARLADAEKDKRAVIARMDKEVALLNKRIKSFEAEIQADKENLKTRPAPDRPDSPVRPAQPSIRKIRGVGEVFAVRLQENGISKASEVARMDKAKLAEILQISEGRAAEMIKAAKQVQ